MTALAKPGRTGWSARSPQERLGLRLLLPVFVAVFIVAMTAFLIGVARSFTNDQWAFVGLRNYQRALANPQLLDSIKQSLIFAGIVLPTEIIGGLGLALLVHRNIRSSGVRAAIYVCAMVPIVIPPIAVGVTFLLIFIPDYGVVNVALGNTGHNQVLWLSNPLLAMLSVASADVWQWTPFVYLVMFAGLQTVPHESVEAAQVDGAGAWTQFRQIELYYLRPLLLLVLFFRIADVLRVFDSPYVMTGGGPGSATMFFSLYLYKIAFSFSDFGAASALAVIVVIVMTVLYAVISRWLPAERA